MRRITNYEQRTMRMRSSYSIKHNSSLLGFTLVELLVVIAIIGVLISMTLLGLQGSRESARNAKRKSDIEEMRAGLELYKADCKSYPQELIPGGSLKGDDHIASCSSANTYLTLVPNDPFAPDRVYRYYSDIDGLTYEICAGLEKEASTVTCGGFATCGGTTPCNYKAVNP